MYKNQSLGKTQDNILKYSAHSDFQHSWWHSLANTDTLKSKQIITVYHMLLLQPIPMKISYDDVTGTNKTIRRDSEMFLGFFLFIIHTGIGITRCQTIFLPDLIMPLFHLRSPLLLTGPPVTGLPLHLRIFSLAPNFLTLAAAVAANKDGDDDYASQHWHGNDQGLEVYPAQPPSCFI